MRLDDVLVIIIMATLIISIVSLILFSAKNLLVSKIINIDLESIISEGSADRNVEQIGIMKKRIKEYKDKSRALFICAAVLAIVQVVFEYIL